MLTTLLTVSLQLFSIEIVHSFDSLPSRSPTSGLSRLRLPLEHALVLFLFGVSVFLRAGKGLESVWLLAFGAALLVIMRFVRWIRSERTVDGSLPKTSLTALVLLGSFVVLTVLSFLTSQTKNYGFDEVLMTTALGLVFLWAVTLSEQEHRSFYERFSVFLTIVTFIAIAIGCAVYIFQPLDRLVGTFFDSRFHTDYWPNAWGDFLLLTLPIVTARSMRVFAQISSLRAWLRSILLLSPLLAALFLSYSRGSILVLTGIAVLLTVLLLVSGLFRLRGAWRSLVRFILVMFGSTTIALGLFFGVNAVRSLRFPVQSVAAKVEFRGFEGRASIDERSQFMRQAFAMSMDRPFLGYGPYSFRFLQPKYATGILATSDHPHNVVLKFAMERGWPAAIFFVLFVCFVFFRGITILYRQYRAKSEAFSTTFALVVSMSGVLLHSLIDYNLQFVSVVLPLFLILGLLVRLPLQSNNPSLHPWLKMFLRLAPAYQKKRTVVGSRTLGWVLLCGTLASIGLIAVCAREGVLLFTSSLGRHNEAKGEIVTALRLYAASDGAWFDRDRLISMAQITMRLAEQECVPKGGTCAYLQRTKTILDRYQTQNIHDARLPLLRGLLLNRLRESGQGITREEVLAELNRAYTLSARTGIAPFAALVHELARGERSQYRNREKEFLGLFSDYTDAILANTHFIDHSANVEEYVALARTLAILYPRQRKAIIARSSEAFDHALLERARLRARGDGLLW